MEINEKVRTLVVFCEGGIGKNLAFTAVIRAIKKAHPTKQIVVVCGSNEVFMNNPNVKRIFNFGNALHFYEDWVNDETQVIKTEPYLHYDYVNKKRHLVEVWCDQIDVPCDGIEPDLYFTPTELEGAKLFADEIQTKDKSKLIMVQWIGGKVPQSSEEKSTKEALTQMFRRAMPQKQAQDVVTWLADSGYAVFNVAHANFPQLTRCKTPQFPLRVVMSLLTQVPTFIGIDSFLQHAAAARQVRRPGVVIWGGTSKICLGYDLHTNLEIEACPTPACHRPNSYLMDVMENGMLWDCPYGESCMKRPVDEIKNAVESILKV